MFGVVAFSRLGLTSSVDDVAFDIVSPMHGTGSFFNKDFPDAMVGRTHTHPAHEI